MDVGCEAAHVPLLGFGGKWGMLLTRPLLNEVAWRWGGHSAPASRRISIYRLMEKALIGGPPLYHWFFNKAASGERGQKSVTPSVILKNRMGTDF